MGNAQSPRPVSIKMATFGQNTVHSAFSPFDDEA